MEQLAGAWVEEMSIRCAGGDEPKISFSGGAKSHILTAYSTVFADASGTSLEVVNGDNFENGSVVQIGTSDATGAGHTLTAKTNTTGQRYSFTVTPAITGTQAAGLDVIPFFPAVTYNGSPIAGITGSVALRDTGGTYETLDVTDATVTLKNMIKPLNNLAFYQEVPDVNPGYREVFGEVTVRARRDRLKYLGTRKDFTVQDLRIVCGSVAGFVVAITARVELEFGDLDLPESEEGYFKLPFFGQSGAGLANELSIVIGPIPA
jgi:hypothetical protein